MFAPRDAADVQPQADLSQRTPALVVNKGGRPKTHDFDRRVAYALARELQMMRWESGLSQYELAKRLGISRGRVACAETGKRETCWSFCIRWARACKRSSVDVAVMVERVLAASGAA